MANNWVSHVKAYAEKKKMKYNDALKSAECKAEYQKNKPKSSDETKQEMNKVIMKTATRDKMSPKKSKMIIEEPMDVKLDMVDTTVKVRKPRVKKSTV